MAIASEHSCFSTATKTFQLSKHIGRCETINHELDYFSFYPFQGLLYHRTCKPDFLCSWPFAKFLSRIQGASIMDTALHQKFSFILDRNLAKANCTGNQVYTSCDIVVLVSIHMWESIPLRNTRNNFDYVLLIWKRTIWRLLRVQLL